MVLKRFSRRREFSKHKSQLYLYCGKESKIQHFNLYSTNISLEERNINISLEERNIG